MPAPSREDRNLAAAFLAGEWEPEAMTDRAALAVGKRYRFLLPLTRRVLATFPVPPDPEVLTTFLLADSGYRRAGERHPLDVVRMFWPAPRMAPSRCPVDGELPALPTVSALADWLGVTAGRLAWYADTRNTNWSAAENLRHYAYAWTPKPGGRARLLEAPKPVLKRLQRKVLHGILDLVPPHPAAHGFRRGRSIVTNAAPHCGRAVVLRFDLTDFFPSVSAARVRAVFRSLGYPAAVAGVLTGLCTTRLPADVWTARPSPTADGSDHPTWQRFADRHLPQGAPTSPALANLAAYRLDRRLAGLADSLGATYTRYADDLTLSGGDDLAKAAARVRLAVIGIAVQEGFALNPLKSRVQGRGGRQVVAGVVVNVRPNVPRAEFDALKAVLTNCARRGPASQNRAGHADFRAHLAGRVSHVAAVNPARGRKLWAIFDRIDWRPE
jgi:hypothetical protein